MSLVLVSLFVVVVTSLWLLVRMPKHPVDQLPGPSALPFFGNALEFTGGKSAVFRLFKQLAAQYGTIYRTWQGKIPIIHTLDPKHLEMILTSSVHITKSHDYNFITRWLGTGLLISTGSKWHKRRKMLTPAFHFKILEQFVPTFSDNSRTLVTKLRAHLGRPVDVVPLVTRCALDVICETAMGVTINAQEDSDSEYVTAMYEVSDLIVHRIQRPWLYPDWIFHLVPSGRKHNKCLEILHGFTNKVIRERREEMRKAKLNGGTDEKSNEGRKKPTAFLDLLLQASDEDGGLTDEDIREEVDTFMFEGHDTTAMAMSWALLYLGAYPEVQSRCVSELSEIFHGSDRSPTMSDLAAMKYLERVIKETLRIRPSVAGVGRKLQQTLKIDDVNFPRDTKVQLHIYDAHHNADFFPDPEKFDPDRFLPENSVGRHPYAYIPFSAGPRNCIGQKFAMLEMKSLLSTLLRNFHLESIDPEHHSEAVPDFILRPVNGVQMKLTPREYP